MGIFDDIAERKIKEAIENNEFEDLRGFGIPVDNSSYFSVSQEKRMAFHMLKNANVLPEEMQLKKEIIYMNQLIRDELSKEERDALINKRAIMLTKLDVFLEKYRNGSGT